MLGNVTAELLLGAVSPFIDAGNVPGAVVGFLRNNQTSLAAAGSTGLGGSPLTDDALMRISSNTKPMVAVLAELAHRRVLRRLDGPLEDTVPAECAVTVEDLLTMRLGFGFVFEADCAAVGAAAQAGLGIGPPDPSVPLTPDAWIERFAKLPLLEQPGTVWRYDVAYAVLGVVLARACGAPLDAILRDRLFDPLGMTDIPSWRPRAACRRASRRAQQNWSCSTRRPTAGGAFRHPSLTRAAASCPRRVTC